MRWFKKRKPWPMEIREEQWFAFLPVTVDVGKPHETRWLETVRVQIQYQQRYDTRTYEWRAMKFLPVKTRSWIPRKSAERMEAE